jgi:hypothetical protein
MRDDNSDCSGPIYDDRDFERRFRMSRALFDRVLLAVVADNDYLRLGLKRNAVGVLGASPLQKVVAAMGQLTLGIGADAVD